MRILYCATDQAIPGTTGGAVHVASVAAGLAARGHEVHVAAARTNRPWPEVGVHWHDIGAPFGRPQLRLVRASAVRTLAHAVRPDVVIERYHNFGGEGALAARAEQRPLVLEVNAPVVDHPGSLKASLDRALLARPLRRWRDWQCRRAALFVTPVRSILPAWVDPERVVELEWGADTERFTPAVRGPVPYVRQPGDLVVVFAGAFRSWHGAHLLAEALAQLGARGRTAIHGVFIGDGPELSRVKAAASGARVTLTGAIPHEAMPAALAAADIGVAPFDAQAHAPLTLAFYWSPLKVFEYMAAGLPPVMPRLPRLAALARDGIEAQLYEPADARGLADALEALAAPERRAAMGAAARTRVVRDYSWQAHCARLEAAMETMLRGGLRAQGSGLRA